MTDLNFQAILDELAAIHEEFPEITFGSAVQHAIDTAKRGFNKNLSDITSKELLAALKQYHAATAQARSTQ